jgi:hypothetical protein
MKIVILRTGHCGLTDSAACDCEAHKVTSGHILQDCHILVSYRDLTDRNNPTSWGTSDDLKLTLLFPPHAGIDVRRRMVAKSRENDYMALVAIRRHK